MEPLIKVERVSLSVPIYLQPERGARSWGGLLLGALFDPPRRRLTRLLDDISFEGHSGDRIAILGRNGAGKSTLLRVLNGVYAPTAGQVQVSGSCQALLNMSLGFNGEATVRENIFLRGTAMGLKAADLRDQIGPILEFSGLYDKASHRLRTLSAGQKMRLGFAISTTFQHDIILMDEWVGAGDSQFMAKATERMKGRVGGSKIVMLASHSVGLLREICNKGIVLERGRLLYAGDIVPALEAYNELLAALRAESNYIPSELEYESEPESAPLAHGYVETLSVEAGVVHARGWCVSNEGVPYTGLVLELDGERYPVSRLERYQRPDVARHLGLRDSQCGFQISFEVARLQSIADLGMQFQVLCGPTVEQASMPLRLAGSIITLLRSASAAEETT